jgi:hypothetical protein
MDAMHVIGDLQSCLDDSEWERAGVYFGDLRDVAEGALGAKTPQIAGAIALTLDGVERAIDRHDGHSASNALRHLAYLL